MVERRARDRRSEWKFVITDDGWLWAVTRPSGMEERASIVCETLKQAGDDAIAHGYGAWKSDDRRAGDRREVEH